MRVLPLNEESALTKPPQIQVPALLASSDHVVKEFIVFENGAAKSQGS